MSAAPSSDPGPADRAARSDVVLVAARRSTYVALVDVLRDWSALGLVGTVHLLDTDSIRPADVQVPAVVLEHGLTRPVVLQNELAVRPRTDRARIVVVDDVAGSRAPVSDETALLLTTTLTAALPTADPILLRLIAVDVPTTGVPSGRQGWHNLVLAPESSQSPAAGVAPIVADPGDPLRVVHLAAAVASLAGLWSAQPNGPLDAQQVKPGGGLLAMRTFTRHLSADAVDSELLARLASVENGYPLPVVEGSSALVVDDEVKVAGDMADELLTKHDHVFPRVRVMPQPTRPRSIGALEALGMLFTFLGQALANAPKAFLDAAVRKASAGLAGVVGNAVFAGRDTEFVVVVNGMRADGTPASWAEVDDALDAAAARAQVSGAPLAAAADLSGLWKDFVGAGLTLVDAQNRSQELPPRLVGGRRAVVSTPTRIVPDPAEIYRPPENVSAFVKDRTVASYDVAAARSLDAQLADVAIRQPHVAGLAASARQDLATWFTARRRSYAGRVGHRLATSIEEVRAEIVDLTRRLAAAENTVEVPSRIEDQQRTLAQRLRLISFGAALAVLVAALVVLLGPPTWPYLVIAVAVIVAIWLGSSMYVFLRGQRDLFALLHERSQLADQVRVYREHLAEALNDARRLSRAYRQYLDWCKAFGRFIQAPLGRPERRTDDEVLLGSRYPLNHRFGAARPQPLVLDETAARMSRDLFHVGWTGEAWQAFLADVPREMGPQHFQVTDNADLLFTDPGVARQSLLTAWADAVLLREDRLEATGRLRTEVDRLLDLPGDDLVGRLLADVETRTPSGALTSMSYADFVNSLDVAAISPEGAQGFSRVMFTTQALGAEPWRVDHTDVLQSTHELGRSIIVTQLSRGFMAYDLVGWAAAAAHTSTESADRAPITRPGM